MENKSNQCKFSQYVLRQSDSLRASIHFDLSIESVSTSQIKLKNGVNGFV